MTLFNLFFASKNSQNTLFMRFQCCAIGCTDISNTQKEHDKTTCGI